MIKMLAANAVSGLQICLGFAFQVLMARRFGASVATDGYFLAVTMTEFFLLLGASFTEMFVQFYNDLKVRDVRDAKVFYQAVLNFSLITGIASTIAVLLLRDPLIRIFAPGFDAQRLAVLRSFFGIAAVSLVCSRVVGVNAALLNAEMRFIAPPVIALLTPLSNILSLLFFAADFGIDAIAVSIVVSGIAGLATQQLYIATQLGIRPGGRLWHPRFRALISGSISLRIGHQIWSSKDLVTTRILSGLGTGTVALYFYGARIISTLFTVTNAATSQMVLSVASRSISQRDANGVRQALRKGQLVTTATFFLVLIPLIVVLRPALDIMLGNRLGPTGLSTIYYVFLALVPFYAILAIELPLVSVTMALKKSLQVVRVGILFLAIFSALAWSLRGALGIYSIPAALAVAQLQNLAAYAWTVRGWLVSVTPVMVRTEAKG